jgi:hypothetical protein
MSQTTHKQIKIQLGQSNFLMKLKVFDKKFIYILTYVKEMLEKISRSKINGFRTSNVENNVKKIVNRYKQPLKNIKKRTNQKLEQTTLQNYDEKIHIKNKIKFAKRKYYL